MGPSKTRAGKQVPPHMHLSRSSIRVPGREPAGRSHQRNPSKTNSNRLAKPPGNVPAKRRLEKRSISNSQLPQDQRDELYPNLGSRPDDKLVQRYRSRSQLPRGLHSRAQAHRDRIQRTQGPSNIEDARK